ncbi:hypothetical protein BX616_005169, partial [Lobosporangium transversale]
MATTLYRFTDAEGLVHLFENKHDKNLSSYLEVGDIHGCLHLNGIPSGRPSPIAITKSLLDFDHLVCDFDETITEHDTTSSFDTLANEIRPVHYADPQLSWSEILQAYLEDLDKVAVGDLCHLNASMSTSTPSSSSTSLNMDGQQQQPHRLLDPHIRELKCHVDGRTFTPEPETVVPKIPSLQPWIHSQMRKRAVEKVSLDRVYESGNLVGLTRAQIRAYGREKIRLRPGVVQFMKLFIEEQDRKERALKQELGDEGVPTVDSHGCRKRRGELWIVSVNWSQDLIRGAMDQIFGSEEATERYLPDSQLICSNLMFSYEDHQELQKRRREKGDNSGSEGTADVTTNNTNNTETKSQDQGRSGDEIADVDVADKRSKQDDAAEEEAYLSNGQVKVNCLTGTDKLRAFRKIQEEYASKYGLAPVETKWAYLGDSSTDLGCLVEADVGIIIGNSKSLLVECERSGVQVIDVHKKEMSDVTASNAAAGLSQSPALASGFQFPSIHNFPPFYTLQPTASTWKNQAELWSTIIMRYYKHHRLYQLDLDDTAVNDQLFNNQRIN